MALHITGDTAADELLSTDAFALLTGMLLDQQVAMETAFAGPLKIKERAGSIEPQAVAGYDPERFVELFKQTPAVHRYPGSMAGRVQALAQAVVDDWGGDAAAIWTQGDPDGAEVLKRLKALPGFGDQKARIFLALLGKQLGLEAPGWREATGLVRRGREPPLGRRHHRPRVARQGARDEAGGQGRGEGVEVGRTRVGVRRGRAAPSRRALAAAQRRGTALHLRAARSPRAPSPHTVCPRPTSRTALSRRDRAVASRRRPAPSPHAACPRPTPLSACSRTEDVE